MSYGSRQTHQNMYYVDLEDELAQLDRDMLLTQQIFWIQLPSLCTPQCSKSNKDYDACFKYGLNYQISQNLLWFLNVELNNTLHFPLQLPLPNLHLTSFLSTCLRPPSMVPQSKTKNLIPPSATLKTLAKIRSWCPYRKRALTSSLILKGETVLFPSVFYIPIKVAILCTLGCTTT